MNLHKLLSTCFGIGYIRKGSGTVAALICALCWYAFNYNSVHDVLNAVLTVFITVVGIWSTGKVEIFWGKDSNRVVIDEFAGMCVSLLLIPVAVKYVVIAFILFRFFDIAKPLLIRKMEAYPLGWGVMLDDLLAGLYTNFIMQLIVRSNFI